MYFFTNPENQNKFLVPTNPITQTINYNMRFLISDNQVNPIAWEVSKREDTFPVGITQITLKQDLFDPHYDNRELMIANYYGSKITPKPAPDPEPTPAPEEMVMKITYSSTPAIKVGGSYKIFTVKVDSTDVDPSLISWKIQGLEETDYSSITSEENPSVIKIKASKNYSLIGKVFTLELYYGEELKDSIQVEVTSL